jgi:phosphatidylglycerophosphate synthase
VDQVAPLGPGDVIVSTRLLVSRGGLAEFIGSIREPAIESANDTANSWDRLNRLVQASLDRSDYGRDWRPARDETEIFDCDRWLLRRTGKSYDGLVSRYLNRPVSRFVSRILLHLSVTPNQWTAFILLFPAASCFFFSRGTYLGFVIGAACYQMHSILDGCDGEIARIKYLDSKSGPGIDSLGDLIALLLLVAGLSIGLFNSSNASGHWVFLIEGIIAFVLIAVRLGRNTLDLLARGMEAVHSSEHEELLQESGNRFFGRAFYRIISAIARRDVIYVVFLLMAILGLASWIMHFLFIYSVVAMLLLLKGRALRTARQTRPVLS